MSFLGCSLQREGANRSGRGGQEGGGEAGVVPGPVGLEEETHPTAGKHVASGNNRLYWIRNINCSYINNICMSCDLNLHYVWVYVQ